MIRLNRELFKIDLYQFSDNKIEIMNGYELEELVFIYNKMKFVVDELSVGLNVCYINDSISNNMVYLFHIFSIDMNDKFFK
jgi:hypothetical protein